MVVTCISLVFKLREDTEYCLLYNKQLLLGNIMILIWDLLSLGAYDFVLAVMYSTKDVLGRLEGAAPHAALLTRLKQYYTQDYIFNS